MRILEPRVEGLSGQSGSVDDRLERWRLRLGRDSGIDRMTGRAMLLGKRQSLPLDRQFGSVAFLCRPSLSGRDCSADNPRSEEQTSEIQPLMTTSYDVFCL